MGQGIGWGGSRRSQKPYSRRVISSQPQGDCQDSDDQEHNGQPTDDKGRPLLAFFIGVNNTLSILLFRHFFILKAHPRRRIKLLTSG